MYWVILGVKFLIYCILSDVSIGDLEWVPFLTTRYQNESNIDEAKFFLNNHQNPYLTDQIFQVIATQITIRNHWWCTSWHT